MNGRAYIFTSTAIGKGSMRGGIRGSGTTTPTVNGEGERTRESGLMRWLHVKPTEPQEIVWLQPGIDYHIETSSNLNWKII